MTQPGGQEDNNTLIKCCTLSNTLHLAILSDSMEQVVTQYKEFPATRLFGTGLGTGVGCQVLQPNVQLVEYSLLLTYRLDRCSEFV